MSDKERKEITDHITKIIKEALSDAGVDADISITEYEKRELLQRLMAPILNRIARQFFREVHENLPREVGPEDIQVSVCAQIEVEEFTMVTFGGTFDPRQADCEHARRLFNDIYMESEGGRTMILAGAKVLRGEDEMAEDADVTH